MVDVPHFLDSAVASQICHDRDSKVTGWKAASASEGGRSGFPPSKGSVTIVQEMGEKTLLPCLNEALFIAMIACLR